MAYHTYDQASCHDAHEAGLGLQPHFFTLRRAQLSPTGSGRYVLKWPVSKNACRNSRVAKFPYG